MVSLRFKTAKLDYVNPLKKGAKVEAGVKISFVTRDNDAKFFDVSNGIPVNDTTKTNHFYYKENNNAVYINFTKSIKNLISKSDCVANKPISETRQFNRQYSMGFQLFPIVSQAHFLIIN